jgi:hypothetical protein
VSGADSLRAAIAEVVAHGKRARVAADVVHAVNVWRVANGDCMLPKAMREGARKAAANAARGWNTGSTTATVKAAADRAELWRDRAAVAAGLSADVVATASALAADWHGGLGELVPAALALAGEGVPA